MEGTHHISREFLDDFYGNRELGLKEYVEARTCSSWNEILQEFKLAQQQGLFRRDLKPEFLVHFSQKLGELMTDEKLLGLYPSPQDLVMEMANFVSYGISPREKDPSTPAPTK